MQQLDPSAERMLEDLGTPEERGADRPTQSSILIALATEEGIDYFHTPDQTAYATIPIDLHAETWPVRSKGFRRWLTRRYWQTHRRAPSAQAMTDTLGMLEARAHYDGGERPVHVRVGEWGGAIYLDLADDNWRAVEITKDGWSIVTVPPARFRRPKGMLPLPVPVRGGNFDDLYRLANVTNRTDQVLLTAYNVGVLRPRGPYPVLVLHGPQGSGKSTTAKLIRATLDPNAAAIRSAPRDERDAMIAASNSWVLAFDNLSYLQDWLSDVFCCLSTGGGFGTRELYSDGDEVLFSAQRPIILNGIEEIVTRGDLLDRSIIIYLEPIPDDARRDERTLWAEFAAVHPRILGALLDAVVVALRDEPTVQLGALPRMADFARWATAAEPACGWHAGTFLEAYAGVREQAIDLALDASALAGEVRKFADNLTLGAQWKGQAGELLAILTDKAPEIFTKKKDTKVWPQSPKALSDRLRRLAPSLRAVGVAVEFGRASGGDSHGKRSRWISIQKVDANVRPLRPPSSPGGDAPAVQGDAPGDAESARKSMTGTQGTQGDAEIRTLSADTDDLPVWRRDLAERIAGLKRERDSL